MVNGSGYHRLYVYTICTCKMLTYDSVYMTVAKSKCYCRVELVVVALSIADYLSQC